MILQVNGQGQSLQQPQTHFQGLTQHNGDDMKKLLIKKWNGLAVWMLRKTGAWDNIVTELIRITEKSIKLEIEKKKAENDKKEFDNLPAYTKRAIELVKGHDSLEVS